MFTDTINITVTSHLNDTINVLLDIKIPVLPSSTTERCRQYGYYTGANIGDFINSFGTASYSYTFKNDDFKYPSLIKGYNLSFACGNASCKFYVDSTLVWSTNAGYYDPQQKNYGTVDLPVTIKSESSAQYFGVGLSQAAFRVCAIY